MEHRTKKGGDLMRKKIQLDTGKRYASGFLAGNALRGVEGISLI